VTINLVGPSNKTTATDPDGNYSFEGLLPGTYLLTEVKPSGYHRTLPTNGTYLVTFKSTNQVLENKNFMNAVNSAPLVDAGQNQTATESALVILNGTAIDDFSGLTVSWTQLSGPTVALDDPAIEDPRLTAPSVTGNTSLVFELTVADEDGEVATDMVTVLVLNVNQHPVAHAGSDQTVDEDTEVTLNGSGSSDLDGTLTTFAWEQLSGVSVSLSSSSSATTSFNAPEVDEDSILTFRLTVIDNNNATSSDNVAITVENVRSSSGGSGGGGGGGGISNSAPIENVATLPESFFLINPLSKIIVQSTAFVNLEGVSILQAPVGQQIQISTNILNRQEVSQTYVYIIQILDEEGAAVDISFQYGSIDAAKANTLAKSWQSSETGIYTARVFVWDTLTDAPQPLSLPSERIITVV
jgi:hypothetical protein